ncbi:MAG: 50S ribosomal protein L35 [Dehalococcoidia bacterium]|nr:50S ribosomal protein L35 [Dehalococcoidia bacterium]
MPKMKTHKGLKKRIKITGTGKVLITGHHKNNKKMKKRGSKLNSLKKMSPVHKTHVSKIKKMLPNAGIK